MLLTVHRLFLIALACLLPCQAYAQKRLVDVGKLWVTVNYFHPYLVSRDIDWDTALVQALPAIRSANTDEDFSAAVQTMLASLHDPLTHIGKTNASDPEPPSLAQRVRIHHGLPSALPGAADFYQGTITRPLRAPLVVNVPLGGSTWAQVRTSESAAGPALTAPKPERDYAASSYPSVELRILAAYKIWGAIHYFFAYKDLMDEDWDAVFADALPKFIGANDARNYHLAVAEMISRLSDSNSGVQSAELQSYFGDASVGLTIRLVEKRAVVTAILDPAATTAGLTIGDIITAVDGEKISDRIKREANYVSVSTAQSLSAVIAPRLLNGPDGSVAALRFTDADDRSHQASLKRAGFTSLAVESQTAPVHMLAGNIGYANLTRLHPADIDAMFETLRSAIAIIFDARGTTDAIGSLIAARLTEQTDVSAAIVTGPMALEPDLPQGSVNGPTSSYFSFQTIPNSNAWKFKGKTVLLIDERTLGPAEHLGMLLGVANNTEYLGVPSAGADSDLTEFSVPGGLTITFSGHDIRNAKGGPIQRMGLQPTLALSPKLSAIRAHRDVVLEKALDYLRPPSTQALLRRKD